jgi:uncharacterized protein YbjT (DUF2867 family)
MISKMKFNSVMVAGATGYLGKYLLLELKRQGYYSIALARDPSKLDHISVDQIIQAEVTRPETLKEQFAEVDCVISTVGITRQKDGLSYMDVDYQANMNLLQEAKKSGVKKFIYVSVLNGHQMRNLKMVEAKEKFVDELMHSGMDYTVIRPNGFFSDMTEILKMAQKGKVYLFGDGKFYGNPIHGADLARFIVNNMHFEVSELEVGGPEILSQNEIARAAFDATGKKGKIVHIPLWIRDASLKLIRWFTDQKTYGPIEFFMTVMTMDMVAFEFGELRLSCFFKNPDQKP